MAAIKPLRALRYDLDRAGSLRQLIAPPYDVIDAQLRAQLMARSPHNVVAIDLPEDPDGGDPYAYAGATLGRWRDEGVVVQDERPAFWILQQDYVAPDGSQRRRRGFFARVRVEDYGPGRIRPHERTHPGPKEDRLRLTRATKANLSPIFSLFPDQGRRAASVMEAATATTAFAAADDHEGTLNTLWRLDDAASIGELEHALAGAELLIADGHHRYETARAYADEIGGEGDHRYVLMLLCPLDDPGLLVFATHRLLTGLKDDTARQQALRTTLMRDFDLVPIEADELEPGPAEPGIAFGYIDSFHGQAYRLTLKDQAIADAALAGKPEAYRRLDTAVLEAVVLEGALGMSEDDIAHLRGLAYSKNFDDALDAVRSGRVDAAFFLRATPVEQVREVAEAGESMPPKSTYFTPKVPTGLLFNPL